MLMRAESMTSTLQANHLFNHDPFSTTNLFSRSANNRTYAADTSFTTAGFGNNIWQPNSSQDFVTNRSHVGRQSARGVLDLSLKTNYQSFKPLGDKRSPITSDSGPSRQAEPSSAHSRSHNNSTILTPTSLTSHSESASQADHTTQDQRVKGRVGFSQSSFREKGNPWPTAKEFQPSSVANSGRSVSDLSSGQTRRPLAAQNSNQIPGTHSTALQTIWSQNGKDSFYTQPTQHGEFRPVLPTSAGFTNDERSFTFGGFQNGMVPGAVDTIGERRARAKSSQQQHPYSHESPTFCQPAQHPTRYSQSKVTDRQIVDRFHLNAWTNNNYAQGLNSQIAHVNYSQPQYDGSQMLLTGQDGTDSYRNGELSKAALGYGPHAPNSALDFNSAQCRYQYNDFVPGEVQAYPPTTFASTLYGPQSNGVVDFRNDQYTFDRALDLSHEPLDPISDHQNAQQQIHRSPLLEEFRMNGKTKKWELKEIFDHVVEFSGDQLGSRFIQHKLEIANSDDKERVFSEITRDSRQLMTDVFGNYVIQKMFEHGNQSQKKVLASHMKGHVYALSTQTYGCRVVQKALEHILTDQQASLVKELDGCVLKVVENQNGNHVIQKAIERIPGEHIQFIVDAHRGHVHYLSKHPYGCRVIQRMLEHCQPRAKRQILDELHLNISDLIQDAFGNYVVQHVIVNGEQQDRKPVIDKVQSKLLENAMHKFASNVVEKALDYADEEQSRAMLRKLTTRDEHGQSQVVKLLGHQYGNYVIQKSAAHLSGHTLHVLIEEMEQYLMQLRRVSTGKQVTALETSIRDARQRLNSQRYESGIHNAPRQPKHY